LILASWRLGARSSAPSRWRAQVPPLPQPNPVVVDVDVIVDVDLLTATATATAAILAAWREML
jgi:hypothetical protein